MSVLRRMASRRALLGAMAGAAACPVMARPEPAVMVRGSRRLFGSPVEIVLSADRQAADCMAEAWRMLTAMNNHWNAWKPGELSALNAAFRAGRPGRASPALGRMLQAAQVLEQQSLGLFNPGIGGLVGAWGFHDDVLTAGPAPSEATLAGWRAARPSLSQLQVRGSVVHGTNPRLQLDFGAYAKGFAVDRVLDHLQSRGVRGALVNLGGNLATMGLAGAQPWRVGIRNPAGQGWMASLRTLGREAVITSGVYERFRVLDGERATHIIDPDTGRPADAFASVTVLHADAGRADAAATALVVAGPQRWRQVAQRMEVRDVLVIDRDLRAWVTPTLAPRLEFASRAWRDSTITA